MSWVIASGNFASSSSRARNRSLATHVSRSNGTRNLSSRTNQNINDTTHQQANEARNRHPATVQETYEGEGEEMTTRMVTNYNHIHTLSMQYYEVIQNYRVVTRTNRYQRCLFIPLKPFDFRDPRGIFKYRAILEQAALNDTVKEELHIANEQNWQHTEMHGVLLDRSGNELHRIPFANARLQKVEYHVENPGAHMYGFYLNVRAGSNLEARFNDRDLTDVVMSVPGLLAIMVVVILLGASIFNVMLVIGLLDWPGMTRLVRGQILSVREWEYITASRCLGVPDRRIMLVHVLPNVVAPLVVAATFGVPGAILSEAGLSFLA